MTKISEDAYRKLIAKDIHRVMSEMVKSPERDHVIDVLATSPNYLFDRPKRSVITAPRPTLYFHKPRFGSDFRPVISSDINFTKTSKDSYDGKEAFSHLSDEYGQMDIHCSSPIPDFMDSDFFERVAEYHEKTMKDRIASDYLVNNKNAEYPVCPEECFKVGDTAKDLIPYYAECHIVEETEIGRANMLRIMHPSLIRAKIRELQKNWPMDEIAGRCLSDISAIKERIKTLDESDDNIKAELSNEINLLNAVVLKCKSLTDKHPKVMYYGECNHSFSVFCPNRAHQEFCTQKSGCSFKHDFETPINPDDATDKTL